ncbi:MAG: rhodanese-like domain-containing protein [Calditrichaeota bacterium]|nr:MAG: rhodanese-like domain-containing protein [Calditrichota bacterium]
MKSLTQMNRFFAILLVLTIGFVFVGCDDDNPTKPDPATELDSIQPAADAYTGGSQDAILKAQGLFDNMNDGDATNDYFVLSVRGGADFAKGHIPGAINIPWREVGKTANTALLPTDKPIAVYCYTGHTGGIATALLNMMGFEAYNLKFGMGSWTTDQAVRVAAAFNEDTDAHDYTVETTINAPTATFDLPETDYTEATDAAEIVQAAADYVASNSPSVTTAQTVFDNLNDGDTSNDPIIVSVRSATDYAKGHIPGAINIPWREIAKLDNLKVLDPSKEIVIYCYTGHTGAVAAAVLYSFGYKSANMKFGMMSWTKDATVRVASPFTEATEAHDFPVEK